MLILLPTICLAVTLLSILATTEVGSRFFWAVHAFFSGSEVRWAAFQPANIQVLTSVPTTEAGRVAEVYIAESGLEIANS